MAQRKTRAVWDFDQKQPNRNDDYSNQFGRVPEQYTKPAPRPPKKDRPPKQQRPSRPNRGQYQNQPTKPTTSSGGSWLGNIWTGIKEMIWPSIKTKPKPQERPQQPQWISGGEDYSHETQQTPHNPYQKDTNYVVIKPGKTEYAPPGSEAHPSRPGRQKDEGYWQPPPDSGTKPTQQAAPPSNTQVTDIEPLQEGTFSPLTHGGILVRESWSPQYIDELSTFRGQQESIRKAQKRRPTWRHRIAKGRGV